MRSLLREPTAFLPILISAVLLAFVLARIAVFGTLQASDEGTGAHLFQILMPVQFAVAAVFAVRWLPRRRTQALNVLALQLVAALCVALLVFAFHG